MKELNRYFCTMFLLITLALPPIFGTGCASGGRTVAGRGNAVMDQVTIMEKTGNDGRVKMYEKKDKTLKLAGEFDTPYTLYVPRKGTEILYFVAQKGGLEVRWELEMRIRKSGTAGMVGDGVLMLFPVFGVAAAATDFMTGAWKSLGGEGIEIKDGIVYYEFPTRGQVAPPSASPGASSFLGNPPAADSGYKPAIWPDSMGPSVDKATPAPVPPTAAPRPKNSGGGYLIVR